ncbi:hypothetical protein AG1IA_01440 [Rhizoctonia solani AG-1 IA]|uniref:Uncharacterized protein n=2 Tax=Rhizoctonia solani TaxID=456999 RepID=A0A8H7M7Z5_9AGAM|nr:hypothetical protein AG1IA_01440 [Rhizoctonia solani AG-1 IA]KAF8682839.1 hypothetical protein RHS04_02555 [Rhizoctonia solani]KAF8759005.1 hypothetical protein RHS01_02812 [Rhizoctonia solani]
MPLSQQVRKTLSFLKREGNPSHSINCDLPDGDHLPPLTGGHKRQHGDCEQCQNRRDTLVEALKHANRAVELDDGALTLAAAKEYNQSAELLGNLLEAIIDSDLKDTGEFEHEDVTRLRNLVRFFSGTLEYSTNVINKV